MFPLPANATRIRYLESTGSQYIDTGIVPAQTTAVDLRGRFPADAGKTRFGSRVSNGTAQMCVLAVSSNKIRIDVGTGGATGSANASQLEYTTEVCSRIVIDARTNSASVTTSGGTVISHAYSSSATFSGALSMSAFAFNNGGTIVGATEMRVSALQITQSGAIVRSFVPVRVGSVGHLYDRVSGTLFGNAGTGDFVLGPDTFQQGVVPTRMCVMGAHDALPYTREIEYLESTGTQYVDTGYAPVFPSDLEYRARIRWTNTTNRQIMGLQGGMYVGVVNGMYQPGYGGNTTVSASVLANVAYDVCAKFYLTTPDVSLLSRVDWALDNNAGTIYTQLYNYKPANASVWLFFANDATTLRGSSAIYSFQILVNGVLVRDFIPVRKGTTGYLYDRVTKQLFGNAGTGSFVLGPDK